MSFGDKAKEIIASVAPTLGLAFGGPLGGLAGKVISTALGGGDAKSVEAAVLSGDPQTLMAVKNAELQFKQHLADLGVTEDQLTVQDRSSARQMQVATKSILVPSLAIIIVVGFLVMVGSTLLGYTRVESALAGTLIGYLSAKAEQVVAFYFGSSAGSERKTELMAAKVG